jgi:hypothetical protein
LTIDLESLFQVNRTIVTSPRNVVVKVDHVVDSPPYIEDDLYAWLVDSARTPPCDVSYVGRRRRGIGNNMAYLSSRLKS